MGDVSMSSLNDEFDVEGVEIEIEEFKETISHAKEIKDPNKVLSALVDKAGTFLDMIERESVNGAISARYMEVANQLIGTINGIINSTLANDSLLYNDNLKQVYIQQKNRALDQKDNEIRIKELYYKGKTTDKTINNNMLITDRESIIKFLNKENK